MGRERYELVTLTPPSYPWKKAEYRRRLRKFVAVQIGKTLQIGNTRKD